MGTLVNGDSGASSSNNNAETLISRLEGFRRSDEERDTLVQQVIDQFYRLGKKYCKGHCWQNLLLTRRPEERLYHDKCNDFDNEVTSRRYLQGQVAETKRELQTLNKKIDHNSFVLILIDGDGALFQDYLLRDRVSGGSDAAHLLHKEIKEHLKERHEESDHWSIMVQIFANFEGLSKKLAHVGVIKSPGDLHAFARAFSLSYPLFSFIDVGSGKERADHKLKEMFRLFLSDVHCKHIIFVGLHDNGYQPNFEPYKRDEDVASRLTLLETTPAHRDYRSLGFKITRFPKVFMSDELPQGRMQYEPESPPPSSTSLAPPNPPAAIPAAPTVSTSKTRQLPPPTVAEPSSPGVTSISYASVGNNDTGPKQISIAPNKGQAPPRKAVYLNAYDERIDPKLPRAEVQAMNRLHTRINHRKVCNSHHLLGLCPLGSACPFDHGERLGAKEQLALRQKARERVCSQGSDCRDVDCFFGHQCPRPDCTWENCYFEGLHNLDPNIKMKQYEDGSIEIVN